MALTTAEVFTYDGVALNTYAYNISTGKGRTQTPPLRGEHIEVAGRSGNVFLQNRVTGPGEVILTMWVVGHDVDGLVPGGSSMRLEFEKNKEKLLQLFQYNKLSYLTAVQADGTTRECWAYVADRLILETTSGRTRGEFSVALEIPDVYWQDTSDTTVTQTVSSSPGTVNLTSFAGMTAPVEDAVIEVRGPATNPRVTSNQSNIWTQLNRSLSAAETWQFNCKTWTSTVGVTNVTTLTTHWGHAKFMIIPPAVLPQLVLSGTGFTSNTQLKVVARKKYVSG